MKDDPDDLNNIVRMQQHLWWRDHQVFIFELLNKDLFQHIQDKQYQGFEVAVI